MPLGAETSITQEEITQTESKPEELVERYQQETDFPESAPKIRNHLEEMINEAAKETDVPVVLAACDSHSSVGDAEGYNNAMPGSDVDGLIFLTSSPISEDQRQAFSLALRDKINKWLVDLHQSDFAKDHFLSLQEIKESFETSAEVGFDENISRKLSKVLHGTVLYQDNDLDLSSLKTNPAFKEKAQPQANWRPDQMNFKKREKYQVRARLAKDFEEMDASTQALLIKLHLYFVHSMVSAIDPHLDGPNKEELERLHDSGFLRVDQDFDGKEIYRPKWLPQPQIYDIIRAAVLGRQEG